MHQQGTKGQCRICLSNAASQLIDLNSSFVRLESGDEITYMQCYEECTQLEAGADNLPQTICFHCAEQMTDAYAFIQRAKESNKFLTENVLKFEFKDEAELDVLQEYASSQEQPEPFPTNTIQFVSVSDDNAILDEMSENFSDMQQNQPKANRKRLPDPLKKRIFKPEETSCDLCNIKLTKRELQLHNKRKHMPEKFLCHSCPRTFKSVYKLRAHVKIHENTESFICILCDQQFLTQSNLDNHAQVHETNRKPAFQCQLCDKSFFYKPGLKLHMQNHTGRVFECEICSKKYPRAIDVKIHMSSHTGDKPFKCKYCEKMFTMKSSLKVHEQKHEGYRYKCDMCDKSYADPGSMRDHQKTHTGLPFECVICDKQFATRYFVRRHISTVHKLMGLENLDEYIIPIQNGAKCRSISEA